MRSKRSKAWHNRKTVEQVTNTILCDGRQQCPYAFAAGGAVHHCQRRAHHAGLHRTAEGHVFLQGKRMWWFRNGRYEVANDAST